ncbi:hypothetical protein CCAND93_2050001 [Capnocytophaga canis]|uniref:Uncharacterized protein n=1 Tax=Capnocytophaga canis TaxID=1848903 RepID=A0A0B7IN92_9FLAO|nr:hypothetical protein CCAND93_2050001 [Capnocytophaga canis]
MYFISYNENRLPKSTLVFKKEGQFSIRDFAWDKANYFLLTKQ